MSRTHTPELFSANASFGCPQSGPPEFRGARDLLRHMDRLGVARALAWQVGTQEAEPIKQWREAIAELPADSSARLIPATALRPSAGLHPEGTKAIRAAVLEGTCRAIRLDLTGYEVRPRQLGGLLREIEPVRVPVLFSFAEAPDVDGLLNLAADFPHVPLIALLTSWARHDSLLELMYARSNVYADTSWLHTQGVIENMVERFGPERILFGLGPRSNNGASIAALLRASVPSEAKELMAHGNLDRLLLPTHGAALPTAPSATPHEPHCGELWSTLLSGERLTGVDIVDAHGHLRDRKSIERTLTEMDGLGVSTLIVSAWGALEADPVIGNLEFAEIARPYASRISGYLGYNPHYASELAPRLEGMMADRFFVGFKLLCSYWEVSVQDPRFTPVWEHANAHRLPVLIHTWADRYDSPGLLSGIAARYPEAQLLVAHSGGTDSGRAEAEDLAESNPNVYLEFCGSYMATRMWEDTLRRLGASKVVFGSDVDAHGETWEVGRVLSIDAPEADLRAVLGANMRRILSLRR